MIQQFQMAVHIKPLTSMYMLMWNVAIAGKDGHNLQIKINSSLFSFKISTSIAYLSNVFNADDKA